jgi:mono/diheme cytochrome c family protein
MMRAAFRLLLRLGIVLGLGASVFPQVRSIELPGDNPMAELKAGPGVEVVRANCIACHSTDYIVRQPGSDAKRWEGEVKKMIGVYGAPISEADARVIVQYLAATYGLAAARAPKGTKPGKSGAKAAP